jgi:hypothetical protein
MSDTTLIPGRGGRTYTHGSDDYGSFGSVYRTEEEDSIPPPLDFAPIDEELKNKSLMAEASDSTQD